MLTSAEKALSFVGDMTFEQFKSDEKTTYAVIRAIEIIGEASKKIPNDLMLAYPEIPWRDVAGTRDKLVHDYIGVNLKVVWLTLRDDLPTLIKHLKKILEDFGDK